MTPPEDIERRFADFAGRLAASLSFNRSVGQIYGLLYATVRPLSLDEISARLSMSKGNASINLRTLESWGAIRPVYVGDSRKDYYEADPDIKAIAWRRLEDGLSKRLAMVEEGMGQIEQRLGRDRSGKDGQALRKRLQALKSLLSRLRRAARLLPKVLPVL